jgi:hypothetical protein
LVYLFFAIDAIAAIDATATMAALEATDAIAAKGAIVATATIPAPFISFIVFLIIRIFFCKFFGYSVNGFILS